MPDKSSFTILTKIHGEITANILKSHLESEGIPAVLSYESVGRVYGITVDGLGEISILVPDDCLEAAWKVIEPDNNI